MQPRTLLRIDYQSVATPRPSGRYTLVCLALSLLPYPVFAVSFFLEWIDYFGPGIPFYPPVFILFLLLSIPLEAAMLVVGLHALRRAQALEPGYVRIARWMVAISIISLILALAARAYLFLDRVI